MKVFVVLYLSICSCGCLVFPSYRPPVCCTDKQRVALDPPFEGKPSVSVVYGENATVVNEEYPACRFAKLYNEKFPWTVLVQYTKENDKKGYHCGGTLIGARSVLTAAHCLLGETIPKHWNATAVRLGEWGNLPDDCGEIACTPSFVDIPIERFFVPIPERPHVIDIALLRLTDDVPFTQNIKPACLPLPTTKPKSYFGSHAFISARRKSFRQPEDPRPVESVDITSWDFCSSKYEGQNVTLRNETDICALSLDGMDTCVGDSGGGLFIKEAMNFILIGVLSFGPNPCGTAGLPAVYTRIDTHMPFIMRHIL